MKHSTKVKELMIQFLGVRVSAFIHGIRFAMLATDSRFADREIDIVRRSLESGDVAVDVGANKSDWTRQLGLHRLEADRVSLIELYVPSNQYRQF